MNKLTVLSEIHGLITYILELPDSAFTSASKRKEIIEKLVEWYEAVAKDEEASEIEEAYNECAQVLAANITDPAIVSRATGTVDNIKGDIQPTP